MRIKKSIIYLISSLSLLISDDFDGYFGSSGIVSIQLKKYKEKAS